MTAAKATPTDLLQFVAVAAAVFFFIVKPVTAMMNRSRREPIEQAMPDEERRHQELLAAASCRVAPRSGGEADRRVDRCRHASATAEA